MRTKSKINMKNISFAALFLAAVSLSGIRCAKDPGTSAGGQEAAHAHEEETAHGHEGEAAFGGDTIVMSDAVRQEFGITTAVAGPGILKTYVWLPGEVVIPPENLAHVHPRFPGVVKEVMKQPGDMVKAGEALAVIESNQSLSDYTMHSQISGVITEMHLVKGEMVDDETHGFLIADLSKVWVYLKIYQKDLPGVRAGQEVHISAGAGFPVVRSVIDYISPLIDKATRTGRGRVILDNHGYRWKPGLFVTGKVVTARKKADILIPKTAVEIIDDLPVIFIRKGDRYYPRMVSLGRENDESYEVVKGLSAGERYVSRHGFVLKAELQKSEFGEGHEH